MSSNERSHTPPANTLNNYSIKPPTSIYIGTQTDNNFNIGQGLRPFNPHIVKNPFDDITLENSSDYLLNLHKVLGEAFISEAIKIDTNSNKIRRLIELQDWTAIKIFHCIGIVSAKNYLVIQMDA